MSPKVPKLVLLYGWAPLPKGAHLPQRPPSAYIQALQQGRVAGAGLHEAQPEEVSPEAGKKGRFPPSGFLEAGAEGPWDCSQKGG